MWRSEFVNCGASENDLNFQDSSLYIQYNPNDMIVLLQEQALVV